MHNVVIIGAGIAGLAAAWELRKRGVEPLILEQSGRAGGVIVSERVDGFVIDGGPDSILVQKPAAVELCSELGIRDRLLPTLTPRTAFVIRDGRLVPLPETSFLGLPTRIWPLVTTRLFSWPGKMRIASELLRPRRQLADESIGSFIRRRLGAEAVDYIAEPLLAGIHAGDVDQLSVHSLFPRLVSMEASHRSLLRAMWSAPVPGTTNGAFVSLPSGIAELPEALVAALGPDAIRYRTRVVQISRTGPDFYKLTLDTDAAIYARAIIVTVPAYSAAAMFRSLDGNLATLCAAIPYASSATVAFALRRDQVAHPLVGTGFVVPRLERKALMAATWVTSKWPHRAPDGHVLVRAFLGGAHAPRVLDHPDQALAEMAFEELRTLLEISGEPSHVRVFRWPQATPQYVVGHTARVGGIEERLARLPGVFVAGSGYRGTGIPDCIADARENAARAAVLVR